MQKKPDASHHPDGVPAFGASLNRNKPHKAAWIEKAFHPGQETKKHAQILCNFRSVYADRPELLETVEDLKGKEINLISLEERIDITSAAGELVFHVFGAIAQFERRLISKRTKDGMATARKHGRNPGRPPLQPETISALQDLVEAGKSVSQAAKYLGIGRSTAYKVINEASQR